MHLHFRAYEDLEFRWPERRTFATAHHGGMYALARYPRFAPHVSAVECRSWLCVFNGGLHHRSQCRERRARSSSSSSMVRPRTAWWYRREPPTVVSVLKRQFVPFLALCQHLRGVPPSRPHAFLWGLLSADFWRVGEIRRKEGSR